MYLDGGEQLRLNWDSTDLEPERFRAGIGLISTGATASVLTDELYLYERVPSIFNQGIAGQTQSLPTGAIRAALLKGGSR